MTKSQIAIAGGASVLTLGVMIAALARTPDPVSVARDAGVDTASLDRGVDLEASQATDLLTTPVAPGATVTTGVNLPPGHRAGVLTYTSSASGAFETLGVTYRDDEHATWFELTARNVSAEAVRLTAVFDYGPPALVAPQGADR